MRALMMCVVLLFSGCQCGDRANADAGSGNTDSGVLDGGSVAIDGGATGGGATDGGATIIDGGQPVDGGIVTLDGGLGCEGLTAAACMIKPGCRADFCSSCTCAPNYSGCHPKGSRETPCPLKPCPEPACCSSSADCLDNAFCLAPETPPTCGVCNALPSTCSTDAECAPMICEPRACACGGERDCVAGCSVSNPCHTGATCNATNRRCEAMACSGDPQCPSTFKCDGATCIRRTCTDATECGLGACVNGECYDAKGTCEAPIR